MIFKHYVYRHIRLDKNEPFYIGIGTNSGKNNNYGRSRSNFRRNKLWFDVTAKTDFLIEIIYESNDYELVKEKEIEFVKMYGRKDNGSGVLTNLTNGGDGTVGIKFSKETIERMRVAKRNMSQETKEKLRLIATNISEETRKKISDAGKGRVQSEETKTKRAISMKGRTNTPETLLKMSESAKNRGDGYNLKLSLNHPNRKQVINILTGEIYVSVVAAAKANGVIRRTFNYKLLKGEECGFKYYTNK
jgi:hypothetical protein